MNHNDLSAASSVIADQAIRAVRNGELRRAQGFAAQALRMARDEGEGATLQALNTLALVQGVSGRYIESMASSVDAFNMAHQAGNRSGALHAAATMGANGTFILDAGPALGELLEYCAGEAAALGDDVLKARIHNTRGLHYQTSGHLDLAKASFEAALAIVGDPLSRAAMYTPRLLVLSNLAFLGVERARRAEPGEQARLRAQARQAVDTVVALAVDSGNLDAVGRARFGLATLHADAGHAVEALGEFERVLECALAIGQTPQQVDARIAIAQAEFALARPDAAIATLAQAFETAETMRPTRQIATICDLQAEMYGRLGRPREAAHHRAIAERERAIHLKENEHVRNMFLDFCSRLQRPHHAGVTGGGAPPGG
ncbi:MAG: hypothetical protein JNK75_09395 [Betaproteobacteria bacterium]|nr:hypothetical protein [Betaproteobacteria bacterium]